MAPRYPGFTWRGGGGGGSNSHRACSWHEVVSTAESSVKGWNDGANACHGYVGRYGDGEQYAEFDERVAGVKDDNGSVLTIETWDGLLPSTGRSPDGSFGPNDRRWTDEQAERIVDIIAWMSLPNTLNIPVRWMNATNERGHAPHRLGVRNPNGKVKTNTGPASWTAHDGKECPGDQRVLQLRDEIIPAAQKLAPALLSGACTTLPAGRVDVKFARSRYAGAVVLGETRQRTFIEKVLHW